MTLASASDNPENLSSGRLVVDWGGSTVGEIDLGFVNHVLDVACSAVSDPRLQAHAVWLLSVTFVDDAEIAALNVAHRNVEGPTDVLSFPQLDPVPLTPHPSPLTPHPSPLVLGDIVVSTPRARAQAEEYGHSFQRELGFLLVHSVLHLVGHDHQDEQDSRIMRSEEERILAQLDLPR